MIAAFSLLSDFLREAWAALAGALVVFGLLGLLAQTLRVTSAVLAGSRRGWAVGLSSAGGIAFVLLFGTLGVPALASAVRVSTGITACGPLVNLGERTAEVLAALGALRMLWAFVRTSAGLAAGAPVDIAAALSDCGEAVIGMLLAVAAGPMAAHFLGVC